VPLFQSKIITTVATQVNRVIKDELLPNSVKSGVIKSIFEGGDITDYVMEELVHSVGLKADRMYDYGRDHYVHGVPAGQFNSANQANAKVKTVLETLEGGEVFVDYMRFGPPNNLHIGWMKVVEQYGYNPTTNQLPVLSAAKGKPVYLNDLKVVVPEDLRETLEREALEQWGIPATAGYTPQRSATSDVIGKLLAHTPVYSDPEATETYLKLEYIWIYDVPWIPENYGRNPQEITIETVNIPLTGYDDDADYFHAKYTIGDTTKYWIYKLGAGTYPTLDTAFQFPEELSGQFFPWGYFRFNKLPTNLFPESAEYKSTKKLVKYMGLDFDMVADAISENPDVGEVEQAMLMMAVPALTEDPLERRYLFKFFDNLYFAAPDQFILPHDRQLRDVAGVEPDSSKTNLQIADRRFNMILSNGGMFKKRIPGSIGPIGSYSSGTRIIAQEFDYVDTGTGENYPVDHRHRIHYYQKQVSHAFYEELQIMDLGLYYNVFENLYAPTRGDSEHLLIPIDRSITDNYTASEKETLYARSLHFIFNSRNETELDWYQQEWFGDLMIIVAIVVTVFSFGSDGGSLLSAVVAGNSVAITQAVISLLTTFLEALVFQVVLKLFVKLVGVDIAFLVVIVAAVAGVTMEIGGSSVPGAPWADELVHLASGLAKEISQTLQDAFTGLQNEASQFNSMVEQKEAELEKANDLLEGKSWLSPFTVFGETPNDFYNRTIHSGNIGIMGIDAIASYVDVALTLPKLNDTLGDSPYGNH